MRKRDSRCLVLTSLGGKTSAQFNAETARDLALVRQRNQLRSQWPANIPKKLHHLFHLRNDQPDGEVKAIAQNVVGKTTVTELQLSLLGGLTLSGHLWKPTGAARSAVIYISAKPGDYDPLANPTCQRLAAEGQIVLDFNPRGMGPMDELLLQFVPLVESTLTYHGFLLGHPLLGMRVDDVLRAVDLLAAHESIDPGRITLHGVEYGALLALFAGRVNDNIGAVVEERTLTSYSSLCWNRSYAWPVNIILPGILKQMDLEDIRAAVAPRKLTIISPLDHLKQPLTEAQARMQFAVVRSAYRDIGAADNLVIKESDAAEKTNASTRRADQ